MGNAEQPILTPLDKVDSYWPVYMGCKRRYERSGGYDAHLKASWEATSRHMDLLLEAMFAGVVIVTPIELSYKDAIAQELEVESGQGA